MVSRSSVLGRIAAAAVVTVPLSAAGIAALAGGASTAAVPVARR